MKIKAGNALPEIDSALDIFLPNESSADTRTSSKTTATQDVSIAFSDGALIVKTPNSTLGKIPIDRKIYQRIELHDHFSQEIRSYIAAWIRSAAFDKGKIRLNSLLIHGLILRYIQSCIPEGHIKYGPFQALIQIIASRKHEQISNPESWTNIARNSALGKCIDILFEKYVIPLHIKENINPTLIQKKLTNSFNEYPKSVKTLLSKFKNELESGSFSMTDLSSRDPKLYRALYQWMRRGGDLDSIIKPPRDTPGRPPVESPVSLDHLNPDDPVHQAYLQEHLKKIKLRQKNTAKNRKWRASQPRI